MTAYYCLCLIFGMVILCEGKLEKRQVESVCSIDTFNCTNGSCIDSSLTCDGQKDCLDGSDETQNLCASVTCPKYAFRCQYGACVPKIAKCNGKDDCADRSDETLVECIGKSSTDRPSCGPDQYRCKSGQCIDDIATCDGTKDCKDGTDETVILCANVSCPKYSFKCKYGACVSKSYRCDGVRHCIDGSDENHGCPTVTQTSAPTSINRPPSEKPILPISPGGKTCVVPTVEGTIYSYKDSNNNIVTLSPGTQFPQGNIVDENCEEGYHRSVDRYFICNNNGKWHPDVKNKSCLKMCPPMISESLDIKCTRSGENVDCSKPTKPGTKLKPSCKTTHHLPNGQPETPIELICQNNGQWSGGLYHCIPKCGLETFTNEKTLVRNGTTAKYGTSPWNVAIYRKKSTNDYDQICGGTLISSNLVVSAAHCFWHDGMTERTLFNEDNMYKIGVGKFRRDISVIDSNFTQIIDASFIHLKDYYNHKNGFHDGDIALILLPINVKISVVVAPACVDWSNSYTVPSGTLGKIVGWGKTEKADFSPTLLEASLPYINNLDCRKMYQTSGFQNFVTRDTFCAGYKSGQGVDSGDSGGGLTFVHNKLHFLTGIVSIKEQDLNNNIAVFTDVSRHIQWLQELYTSYSNAGASGTSK